jgi:hypothetical protein
MFCYNWVSSCVNVSLTSGLALIDVQTQDRLASWLAAGNDSLEIYWEESHRRITCMPCGAVLLKITPSVRLLIFFFFVKVCVFRSHLSKI